MLGIHTPAARRALLHSLARSAREQFSSALSKPHEAHSTWSHGHAHRGSALGALLCVACFLGHLVPERISVSRYEPLQAGLVSDAIALDVPGSADALDLLLHLYNISRSRSACTIIAIGHGCIGCWLLSYHVRECAGVLGSAWPAADGACRHIKRGLTRVQATPGARYVSIGGVICPARESAVVRLICLGIYKIP